MLKNKSISVQILYTTSKILRCRKWAHLDTATLVIRSEDFKVWRAQLAKRASLVLCRLRCPPGPGGERSARPTCACEGVRLK
jgi:hypothetical protein